MEVKKMKASKHKFLPVMVLGALALSLCGGIAMAGNERDDDKDRQRRGSGLELLRLARGRCHLQRHPTGRALTASDSRSLISPENVVWSQKLTALNLPMRKTKSVLHCRAARSLRTTL